MVESPQRPSSPIRQTTPEALRLAKTLIRTARFGAIAVLDPRDGRPCASRISLAADPLGMPVTLVSNLSFHTKCLRADPRCSLLVGEPGKGDPLAHPRISLSCHAMFIEHGDTAEAQIASRFLQKNPKARLYAEFADFYFVRIGIQSASLNGGFGQAYELSAEELTAPAVVDALFDESQVIAELNSEYHRTVRNFLEHSTGHNMPRFRITGIDSEGIDVDCGTNQYRIWFSMRITTKAALYSHMLK